MTSVNYLGLESMTITGLPGLRSANSLTDLVPANVSMTPESKTELLAILPELVALRRIALWRLSGLTMTEVQDRVPGGVEVVQADL